MQKKYLYGSLIAFLGIIGVWQLAANAQTWSGPKTGCSDPSQTNCNVDGVVWNRSDFATAPVQAGNYKLSGSAEMGQDLRVGKDIYLTTNSTALRLDLEGSTSTINVGNWDPHNSSQYPTVLNVYGNITAKDVPNNLYPQITAFSVKGTNNLCIGSDCRTSWPSGGGGGGTVTSVGTLAGSGLTGGPITTSGNLSLINTCSAGQLLKFDGTQWACANDTDTNSGGTISTINSPDASITVTSGSGPTTGLALNTTYVDDRYIKRAGDSVTGNFDFTGNVAGYGSPFIVTNNGGGIGGTFASQMIGLSARSTETVSGKVAYGVRGITESNSGVGVLGDGSGLSGSVSGIGVAGRGYIGVYGMTANTGVAGIGGMFSANRFGVALKADGQTGIMVSSTSYGFGTATGPALWAESEGSKTILANKDIVTKSGRFCLNNAANPATDCVSAWPSAGSGDITDVNQGTGITVTNPGGPAPSVAIASSYQLPQSCTNGQVAKSNGSGTWTCQADSVGSGTITGVTAGTGLTGGGNSGNVSMSLDTTYTDNVYVNAAGDSMTGHLSVSGIVDGKALILNPNPNGDSYFISGSLNGYPRWGLIQESGALNIAIPDAGVNDREFQVSKYYPTGIKSLLFAIRSDNGNTFVPSGNFYIQGPGKKGYQPGGGSWGDSSDQRLKKDIKPLTNGLDQLSKLKPVNFKWINPEEHLVLGQANENSGFIAQDVEKIFPNWVSEIDATGNDAKMVDNGKIKGIQLPMQFDALVVESIKELKTQNDMLQAENSALLKRIEAIEAKLK